MKTVIYFLLLTSSSVFSLLLTRPSGHDIYNGRHFDELISENGKAKQSAVLIMYKPSCDSKLQEYKLSDNLPMNCYVTFLKYDYETTPKYSWYHFDYTDDLKKRYEPKDCIELLYFPVGTPMNEPIRTSLKKFKKISEAVWSLVKVKFSIRNLYGSDISVRLEVKKKVVSSVVLKPMHEEIATAFVTHNLYVNEANTGKLIYATIIDLTLDNTEIAIDKYIDMNMNEDQWQRYARDELDYKNEVTMERIDNVAYIYMRDMKQPAVIPTYSEAGYEVQKVPSFLMKELMKYYNRERDETQDKKRVKKIVTDIEVDPDISQKVDLIMRIIVEEWIESNVQFTKTNPIKEHRNGSVNYGHLGNIKSQVIGLHLVLKKDLGGEKDWIFEMVGHDGIKKNLTLDAGEFIIYEASTCLLSNPYQFTGNLFVTVNIFYIPDDAWNWTYSSDNKNILNGNEIQESLNIFATSSMLERSKLKASRDEL